MPEVPAVTGDLFLGAVDATSPSMGERKHAR